MPISALDDRVALLVIDLQAGTLGRPTAHPKEAILARTAELIGAFRRLGLPIVLATVDGTPPGRTQYGEGARTFPAGWAELAPELPTHADDILVTRTTWSAFAGTDLHATLTRLGVTQVVLTGVATSFGIESSARQAYDLGYNVAIVIDAVTDPNPQAHEDSVTRLFPTLGQTGTSAEILALLPD